MSKEGIPLQHDMFTGKLVDNRSRSQKQTVGLQQMPMFSLHETFEFGARVRPYLANTPRQPLQLVSEDPRTPEEIEQDLIREAQRHTVLMPGLTLLETDTSNEGKWDERVGDEKIAPSVIGRVEKGAVPTQPQMPDTTLEDVAANPAVMPIEKSIDENAQDESVKATFPAAPLSKYAAYLELVRLAQKWAATLIQLPATTLSEIIAGSLAQYEAKRAELTESEILMAIAIGTFRGKTSADQQAATFIPEPETAYKDIPILWLNRDDLLKRRPDLAIVISRLDDCEVAFIPSKVGEALEEFYWIQLSIVLPLMLDHSLKIFI